MPSKYYKINHKTQRIIINPSVIPSDAEKAIYEYWVREKKYEPRLKSEAHAKVAKSIKNNRLTHDAIIADLDGMIATAQKAKDEKQAADCQIVKAEYLRIKESGNTGFLKARSYYLDWKHPKDDTTQTVIPETVKPDTKTPRKTRTKKAQAQATESTPPAETLPPDE